MPLYISPMSNPERFSSLDISVDVSTGYLLLSRKVPWNVETRCWNFSSVHIYPIFKKSATASLQCTGRIPHQFLLGVPVTGFPPLSTNLMYHFAFIWKILVQYGSLQAILRLKEAGFISSAENCRTLPDSVRYNPFSNTFIDVLMSANAGMLSM